MSEGTEIIDCEVVSDGASERAGAVLLKDAGEPYASEIIFTKKDNEIKYVRKGSVD